MTQVERFDEPMMQYVPWSAELFLRFFGNRGRYFWMAAFVLASVGGAIAAKYTDLPSGYGPWFPPAGLALACFVVGGWRMFPLVLFTRFLDTAATYPSDLTHRLTYSIWESVIITAVFGLAAQVLRRFVLTRAELREFGWIVAVGVIGAPFVAAAGIVLLQVVRGATLHVAVDDVRPFWVGDSVSIAAILPLIMVGRHLLHRGGFADLAGSQGGRVVALLQSLSLFVAPMIAVWVDRNNLSLLLVGAILPSLWVSGRRDPFSGTLGVFVVNNVVALVAANQLRPTASLVELQAIMLVASIAALYVIALTRTQNRNAIVLLRRQAEQMDEERLSALALMAGGVAHDLRGLISVIVGNAYVIEKGLADGSMEKSFAKKIDVAARSAERITDRLLAFARNRPSSKSELDLSQFLLDAEPLMRSLARNNTIDVQPCSEPCDVYIDPAELEQVLMNLVVNASQASPQGASIELHLSMVSAIDLVDEHEANRSPRWCCLAVRDHGRGIAPQTLQSVFDPFFTTKGEEGGSGLGLSTVRTIVNEAGGFVRVHSVLGEGTTFDIYLPAAAETMYTRPLADVDVRPMTDANKPKSVS